jgi:WD40 repeat protein
MSRIFLSHSSKNNREAIALRHWLITQEPALANEIFLDLHRDAGIEAGVRWKDALTRAHERCEAVICLLTPEWEASDECRVEYRVAETLNKKIFCARLSPDTGVVTQEWQWVDLFGDGPKTTVKVPDQKPVAFLSEGLHRLREGIRSARIGATSFVWDPNRDPYRGWEPLEEADAGIYFGRDTEIISALDAVRGMRAAGVNTIFVVLGPSGTGKSSFLRAGLLPRLRRDEENFLLLDPVRPEDNVLTGDRGFAQAIHSARKSLGLKQPSLSAVKQACTGDFDLLRKLLREARDAASARLLVNPNVFPKPTVVVPVDQAEELLNEEGRGEAERFFGSIAALAPEREPDPPDTNAARDDEPNPPTPGEACEEQPDALGVIVLLAIRTDRYEALQRAPELAGVGTVVFDHLKPLPRSRFVEVITGPAARASEEGQSLEFEPALVNRLADDAADGADTLPLLALALARLCKDYGGEGILKLTEYEAMGGMREVLRTVIDSVLTRRPEERNKRLALLRRAFIPALATINPDGDRPLRRIAKWSDLPAESEPLIKEFVEKRLLLTGKRDGEVVVEVALESLLWQWDELAGWLDEERDALKTLSGLERTVADWDANNRSADWLFEGERLKDAELLCERAGFEKRIGFAREFLAASRKKDDDRRRDAELQREAELQAARAEAQAREATAQRLVWESLAMLDRAGSDARVFQQLLAADSLALGGVQDALFTAAYRRRDTVKIIEAGAEVLDVAWSTDGRRIAAACRDNTVRLFDGESGQCVGAPLAGHGEAVRSVAFSPDGSHVASGGEDRTARIWNVDTGEPIGSPLAGHQDWVGGLAFSPDGSRLVTGGFDNAVRLWDAVSGQPVGSPMRGHSGAVTSVAFSGDGRFVVSGGEDKTVRVWVAASGQPVGAPLTGHSDAVTSVAFSHDGQQVVSGSRDQTVRLWDAGGGPQIRTFAGHEGVVRCVAFSGDRHVVSGGDDQTVRVWDADTGQPVGAPLVGHGGRVYGVAFSSDGRRVVSGSADHTLRVWDVIGAQVFPAHGGGVESVVFTPDGARIVSGGADGSVRLWDSVTGQPIGAPLTGHEDLVHSVAVGPDGRFIVSGSADTTVRMWDPSTGEAIGAPLIGHSDRVSSVAVSSDGRRIVSGSADETLRLWEAGTGMQIGQPMNDGAQINRVAFSPDGRRIASAGWQNSLRLWDAKSRQPIGKPLAGHENFVWSVAFSPDGRKIVSGGADETVRLWDANTGKPIGEPIRGHEKWVLSVAFDTEGQCIASASADLTVRLWDSSTGRPIGAPLSGHERHVQTVAFSPDGQQIVSGALDGMLRLWPAPAASRDLLRSKMTQNMSNRQWREWVSSDVEYTELCPGLPVAPDDVEP